MILKILVLLLFIGIIVSLSSGLVFLLKGVQSPGKRTLYALGIRVSLAALLLVTIFYGLYTGEFGSGAPWDRKMPKGEVKQNIIP